jgi:uncharacterized protein (TIGR02246 family)
MSLNPNDQLAAESQIRNLIAQLAHLADDGNLDDYIELFTEDASWSHRGDVRLTGKAEIRKGAESRIRDAIQGPGTGTRHLNTTLYIELDGPTHARALSYYLFLGTHGGVAALKTGRYVDRLRRTDRGWKLASRELVEDVN